MPSAFWVSLLGAFQASVSLLLTLGYGLIAARLGMVRSVTARDVSLLCRNFFLPALLITDIGSQLNVDNVANYVPILAWAVACAVASIVMGKIAVRSFGLPSWTVVAVTFNNATSLPLLLTRSLLATGLLNTIVRGDVKEAVNRAGSYFLVNSLVSKILTFAIGPQLLGKDVWDHPPRVIGADEESRDAVPNERTALVPKRHDTRAGATATTTSFRGSPTRERLLRVVNIFDPVTWGGIIAALVGLVPALHRAAFAPGDQGGWLNAWLTSSLRNVGALFSTLQLFIVGSKLSDSFDVPPGTPSPQPPKSAVIAIILIRFVVWSVISIPVIYLLAAKTTLLGDDPILWWSMMLMPVGPPAVILSVLLEVTEVEARAKMMVARMLAYTYMVTPIIAFAIVGALNATEAALDARHPSG